MDCHIGRWLLDMVRTNGWTISRRIWIICRVSPRHFVTIVRCLKFCVNTLDDIEEESVSSRDDSLNPSDEYQSYMGSVKSSQLDFSIETNAETLTQDDCDIFVPIGRPQYHVQPFKNGIRSVSCIENRIPSSTKNPLTTWWRYWRLTIYCSTTKGIW